jgi:hypothetical protein
LSPHATKRVASACKVEAHFQCERPIALARGISGTDIISAGGALRSLGDELLPFEADFDEYTPKVKVRPSGSADERGRRSNESAVSGADSAAVLGAFRSHIDVSMGLCEREVSLLDVMERDPSDLSAYVAELDRILCAKVKMAVELRSYLQAYQRSLADDSTHRP